MKSKVTMVIPTYNEASNIEQLTNELLKLPFSTKVVYIDDNSPDGTGEMAEKLAKKNKNKVYVLHRKRKLGLGSAYIKGFRWVLHNLEQDYIMSMDADFSHDPKHIPRFIEKMKRYPVVIGSRYIPGGGVSWPIHRRMMSLGANIFSRILLELKVSDVTGAFRCIRAESLVALGFEKIKSNGYSFQEEFLYFCKKKRYRIGEVPIFFKDRTKGKSKLNKIEILKFFTTIIRLRLFG